MHRKLESRRSQSFGTGACHLASAWNVEAAAAVTASYLHVLETSYRAFGYHSHFQALTGSSGCFGTVCCLFGAGAVGFLGTEVHLPYLGRACQGCWERQLARK